MQFSAFNTGFCGGETVARLQGRRHVSVGYELTKCHTIRLFFFFPQRHCIQQLLGRWFCISLFLVRVSLVCL